jgi:flagellin
LENESGKFKNKFRGFLVFGINHLPHGSGLVFINLERSNRFFKEEPMPLRIFNNVTSVNTQRSLDNNNNRVGQTVERIASGVRVNSAADDGASFAISESLRSDTRVLKQAGRNVTAAVSLVNTADGALNKVSSTLIRLRELATNATTGTIGDTERETLQLEFNSLKQEIDRIAATSEFNGQKLLNGDLSNTTSERINITLGIDSSSENQLDLNAELNITDVSTTGLGLLTSDISTSDGALKAVEAIESIIDGFNATRGRVGITQQRLDRSANNINVTATNIQAAESILRDADLGQEFAELTKSQILVQSSSAMVGQSNLIPNAVLQLLE